MVAGYGLFNLVLSLLPARVKCVEPLLLCEVDLTTVRCLGAL